MLEKIFNSLGLSKLEVKIYLQLLEIGPSKIGDLAKKLAIPRASLYGIIKNMIEKGVANESLQFGIKIFAAENPQKINTLFKKNIEDLQAKQNLYQNLIPELEKRASTQFLNPKFQLFEGEEGVKQVLQDMLLYDNLETEAFWPAKAMIDILSGDYFRYHNKERIKNNTSIRALWPPTQVANIKQHPYLGAGKEFLREIRVTPKEVDYSMGYWIYGNKVAFVSSRKESFGFIIESQELTQMLLSQFNLIWKISTPLPINPNDTANFIKDLNK